jgi:ornithine cyclodeaminase/alanine dehydrogenase-like protein (mu-crystallin family)
MKFFNELDIENLLSMRECIEVMRNVFSLDPMTDIQNPLRQVMPIAGSDGLLGLMPAIIRPYGVMGVKVLTVYFDNYKIGLSSHQGVVNLFETKTGQPLASFDADAITAIRTAAVSGLMTDLLAPEDATTLCLIGSGKQAAKHLEAVLCARNIKKVNVWSPNAENAQRFCQLFKPNYPLSIEAFPTAQAAVADADIICTVTSATEPVIFNDWLKDHVHINAVGASNKERRELSSSIVQTADVYVDSYESAMNEAGDILLSTPDKTAARQLIRANIHELLTGKIPKGESSKTVFKSLGLAMEDVAAAWFIYQKAV